MQIFETLNTTTRRYKNTNNKLQMNCRAHRCIPINFALRSWSIKYYSFTSLSITIDFNTKTIPFYYADILSDRWHVHIWRHPTESWNLFTRFFGIQSFDWHVFCGIVSRIPVIIFINLSFHSFFFFFCSMAVREVSISRYVWLWKFS